jgi:hypothetical protein
MGSGAVIYVPNFIKIGSGVQKLMGRIHTHTHTQTHTRTAMWPHKPTLFVQNKESRLKIERGLWDHLIVEPEETAVTRQRLSKHVPTTTNTHTTIEDLWDAVVVSVCPSPQKRLNACSLFLWKYRLLPWGWRQFVPSKRWWPPTCHNTWFRNPEDRNMRLHRRESIESHFQRNQDRVEIWRTFVSVTRN